MAPHQERVIEEERELTDKINKLVTFIGGELFKSLNVAEQARLKCQLDFMKGYDHVLRERIGAFTP